MSPRPGSNILVVALLPIGDTLFATPAIHAVRLRYPRARVTALTYPTNGGILSANPDVDEICFAPTRARPTTPALFAAMIHDLRATHFDLVLEFSSVNYGLRFQESATSLIDPSGQCQAYLPYGQEGVLVQAIKVEEATGLLATRYAPERYQECGLE